jgi:hypothetical protein
VNFDGKFWREILAGKFGGKFWRETVSPRWHASNTDKKTTFSLSVTKKLQC